MFPEDTDPVGDMQCVLAVKSSIPFLVESRKFPFNFSEHLYFTDKVVGEYINVPSNLKKDYEYSIFLKRMQVSEMGDITVFKITSEEYPEMEIFRKLISIPSVVIDYKYIEKGYHKTVFTFHHSHVQEVSRFFFNARRTLGNGIREYFGPNRGPNFTLEKASKAEGFFSCVISARPETADSDRMKALFATKWKRRLRYISWDSTNNYLYRIADPSQISGETFKPVSVEDRIYGGSTVSDVSLFYSRRLYEHYNPMFFQYHEFDGALLRICGIVSESYERTLLQIVHEAVRKFPEYGIKVTNWSPIQLRSGLQTLLLDDDNRI